MPECYSGILTMATSVANPVSSLPAERFFRTALFFLVLTSVATLVATGKLDPLTTVLAPALILYKGYRWWRGLAAELRPFLATRLVIGYLFFLPIDALFISPGLARGISDPTLYAIVLAAVHFLIFVTIVRLYSATNDRDALFLAMLAFACLLAAAIFTVDTYFLGFFVAFLIFAVATFVGLEVRRGATNAIYPPIDAQPKASAPLSPSAGAGFVNGGSGWRDVGLGAFLFLSAFQRRLSFARGHAIHVDERFYRQCGTWRDWRDQEKHRRRDARKNRQSGGLCDVALARDRADQFRRSPLVLQRFDARRSFPGR